MRELTLNLKCSNCGKHIRTTVNVAGIPSHIDISDPLTFAPLKNRIQEFAKSIGWVLGDKLTHCGVCVGRLRMN